MRLTKKTSKRVLALLISALMIISMLPVSVLTVFALSATDLKTDIAEKTLYTEQATEFTFTTKASSEDVGKMVLGTFKLLDENGLDAQSAVKSLKYWDEANGCYSDFYGDFGPAETGFPLQDGATSKFCVTFNKAGNYKVKASIINFTDRSVLVAEDTEVTVKPYASALTTDIDTKTFVNNTEVEFTYTTVANAQRDTMVLGTFSVLDSESKDAKSCIKSLKYWDVTNNCYREFYGDFGPSATGFPLADATSKFHVTFNKAGTYTVNVAIKKFDDGEILCSNTKTITVQDNNSNLTTDITEKAFEVNEKVEFTYTTYAGDFADTMVLGKFTLKKNGKEVDKNSLILEYWDVTNACYREFYGSFGPAATGFPLTDATSKFRVSFKETGKYDILVQMVRFADDTVVCENAATVEVKDTKAPVISEITGNATEWTGSDVTLKVVAADNSGSVAQYCLDGGEWQTSSTFDIKENGKYKFYAKDAAGNISDASAEIEVKYIDKIAPVIGVITLNPDDWTNKAVTVTVPATDVGINVILYKMDNGDWQKENTFTVSDNDIHEFYVKDSLGNENSAPAKIKADKYDAKAPVIKSITPNTTEWVSDKVTVTVDATDEGVMGIAYKLGKDGEWQSINTFDITENGTYQVYVKDALGNEIANPEEIVIGNIDKTAPEIVDFTSTTEDWTNKDVTISGTVKEAESGIAKLQYQIDKGEWTDLAFDKDGKFSITVSDECSVTYTFKCTDKVGNVSEGTYSKTVKIDKTPASVSVNEISDTWKNEQITVVGKAEDTASGIKSAVYDNGEGDKGEIKIVGPDFKFDTKVTKSGEYTYKITVIDEAGNETVIDNVTVKIDLENPVTSVKEADAWTNQKVDVVVTASDDAAGINKVYYKKNGGSEVEIDFIDGSYKFTIPNDADDNAKYEIYSVDNSGRKSTSVLYTAKIDVTKPQKPTITYTKALKYKLIDMVTFGLYNTPVNVTISSSDALSGLKEIKYYFDDAEHSAKPNEEGKITFAIEPENQYKVSAVAYDNAGNDSEKENVGTDGTKSDIGGVIVTLDTTAPKVVSASADITEWTNGEVKISGEVSDDLSGVEHVYYTKDESNTPVEITDFDGKNYNFTINPQSYSGKYYIYCVDHSTNVSEKKCVDVKMDNTSPNVDIQNVSTTEWANSVTVTGKVSDDISGVSKVYWRQGADGEENEATLKEDGTYEFVVSKLNYEGLILVGCYDNAGSKAIEQNFEIQIDSTKPVVDDVKASTSDWTNQNVTITGFAFDEKDGNVASGVKNVKYAYGEVTDGIATYDNTTSKFSFDVPATNYDGEVTVWCIDSAGNESDTVKVRVRMDVEQPKVDDAKASTSDWTNQNVTITGFAFDETGGNVASGVKNVKYAYGEVTDGTAVYDEKNGKYSFDVPATNYSGDVKVWCIDNAGNKSDVYLVAVKMDVEAPKNVEIKYSESVLSKVINAITFGFYKPELEVTVSATDNFALDRIEYTANGVNGKYDSTDATLKGSAEVTHVFTNDGDAGYIKFNAPAEFKGKIEAVAYDCAGNSTEQTANDKNYDEVIVDNVAPNIDITYAAAKENTKVRFVDEDIKDVDNFKDAYQAFYNGKVNATIKVTENNFFEGDTELDNDKKCVIHEVGILVTKTDNDGTVTKTEYLPKSAIPELVAAKLFEDATETKEFTWTTDGNVHTCIIPYEEDADYVVTVKYADFSGNEAEIFANDGNVGNEEGSYTSKIITVDTTAPVVKKDVVAAPDNWTKGQVVISGTVSDNLSGVEKVYYTKGESNTPVEITDFDGKNYKFTINAQSYSGKYYIHCVDYSTNVSIKEYVDVKMDVEAPKNVEIKYSESVLSKVINAITFGFYKPELEVTVSATDNFALDKIEYTANGVNGKYDSTDATLKGSAEVTHVSTNDGDAGCIKFNAPAEFKGKIEAVAYDCAGNSTEQKANNENYDEVIVDAVAPKIDITYAAADENTQVRFVDEDIKDVANFEGASQAFYNGKVNATIKVTENNFFEGDTESKFDNDKKSVIHEVGILVTKTDNDGTVTKTEYLPKSAIPELVAAKLFEDATETKEFTWTTDGNVHTCIIPYEEDADYVVTVKYVDFSGNKADISENAKISDNDEISDDAEIPEKDGNEEVSYTSKIITVDTTAPVVTVVYDNNDVKATYGTRQYLTDKRTATITVTEHNFRADDVVIDVKAKNVFGANIGDKSEFDEKNDRVTKYLEQGASSLNWTSRGDDTFELVLDYTEEANYTFDIEYADLAKNSAKDYAADEFTIDRTKPECVEVKYSETVDGKNVIEKILNTITFGAIYYNEQMEVTITAKDDISSINHFVYSYEANDDVSKVNAELLNQTIAEALENSPIVLDKDSGNFTAKFNIPKKALTDLNQFNGTVHFTAYDRSGNESDRFSGESTIVVDNIKPTSTVTFNEPVQKVGDVSYYDGAINASIVINEANFFSEDVKVVVTKDGVNFPVKVDWKDNNVDVHTGTFTLEAPENHSLDGVYVVNVSYVDRSTNEMTPFVSNPLTIDTEVPVITVSNVKHQSANNGETISFTVSATDTNMSLAGFKPNLKAVIKKDNGNNSFTFETIAIALGNATTTKNANGETVYTYSVNNLEVDGFYSLVCSAVDYANHSVSVINSATDAGGSANVETMNFSVNREGSVFWIETEHNDKYTGETFTDKLNGAYANDEVTVKLHEINVDKVDVNADKKTVFTLNDGSSSEDIELKEGENYSKNVVVGAGGWYETVYTLENSNFDHDGVYSLNVITYDKANNSNVNTKTEAGTISFTLDRTNPVISANIKDDQSVKDTQFWVEFEITETNLNAETVAVKLTDNEGKTVETEVEDLGNNKYRFLVDSGYNYTIEITAKDLAGNESELYKVEHFTVSTNILVLWYANTPLFWGSIGGTLLLAGAVILLVFLKKRKKNEDK